MTATVLRESSPKARKAHRCSLCTGRIEPGQTYTRTTTVYDGRVYDWLKCDPCADDEITTTVHEWASHPDDGISAEDAYEWATENGARPDAQRYLERARRTLTREVTVHCFFWGTCKHTVTDTPIAASDEMERHYETHADDITRALNGVLVLGVRQAMTATWLCPACHCHVPDDSASLEQLAAAVAQHQTTHERRRP